MEAETVLGRSTACISPKGEVRSVENRSGREAVLLVVIAHPQERAAPGRASAAPAER